MAAHPLLKWPGGKAWIAPLLKQIVEMEMSHEGTYFEPFFGGGAVFFALCPKRAVLSDVNTRLIEFYQTVQREADTVIQKVWRFSNSKECYYRVRGMRPRSESGRAAQFLFLNRTCWGGVFRLNRAGEFNVPFGNSGRVICRQQSIVDARVALTGVSLRCSDFQETINKAERGDVVYADPPYTTLGQDNGFLRYNERLFKWADQERLAKVCTAAAGRGAFVAVSGLWHEDVLALYRGWWALKIGRKSLISRLPEARRDISEVIFFSHKPKNLIEGLRLL